MSLGVTRVHRRGDAPGNSVSEMGERMKGGAVSDERSPDTDAMLWGAEAGER